MTQPNMTQNPTRYDPAEDDVLFQNYRDDVIHIQFNECFNFWLVINCYGDTEAIDVTDNFFAPKDIVKAYRKLYEMVEGEQPDEGHLNPVKEWIKKIGGDID